MNATIILLIPSSFAHIILFGYLFICLPNPVNSHCINWYPEYQQELPFGITNQFGFFNTPQLLLAY